MPVRVLHLTDFRCFSELTVEPDPVGLTVLRGPNGSGKTSVLEAVAVLATGTSLRGAPREAMVRRGTERAVVRGTVTSGERVLDLGAELGVVGSVRLRLHGRTVRRADVAEVVAVSVFSPEDLALVQGGPAGRRAYLDELVSSRTPAGAAVVADVERTLRQRAALLRQASGRSDDAIGETLAVWDARLAAAGTALVQERESIAAALGPLVAEAYAGLSGGSDRVVIGYRRSWAGPLADALIAARRDDLRRQQTTVGPHRDELDLSVSDRPARTQASQGEQRSVALSLRLAGHQLLGAIRAEPPVLLLDDVFSELDDRRCRALVDQLPEGQVLLTTATDPPAAVRPDRILQIDAGHLVGRPG